MFEIGLWDHIRSHTVGLWPGSTPLQDDCFYAVAAVAAVQASLLLNGM